MSREIYVRFWEGGGVRFPHATRLFPFASLPFAILPHFSFHDQLLRNEGGRDGYHCWAEFFADGKWWPLDISEGDKYARLATYYFGHHPANRFELSRGRNLVVEPGTASGPINFLAYPVLEIGGKPVKVAVEFSFNRSNLRR